MKNIIVVFLLVFFFSCNKNEVVKNSEWLFVACEGNYGSSNGSIYMINQFGEVDSIPNLGDVVQSVKVYNDKLFVLVNNSHKIHIYNINPEGLSFPGITIDLIDSSPREMEITNNKLFFTNWNSNDVKYLDLFNYKVDRLFEIDGLPEDIINAGEDIYVAVNMKKDYSSSDKVIKYNLNEGVIKDTISVGNGPLDLEYKNESLYVSRTYYDENFSAYHGTSEVSKNSIVKIKDYGKNTPCGGSIHNIENTIYRSALGGIVELDDNLELILNNKIGDFNQSEVYSVKYLDNKIYFGLTDYNNLNQVRIYSKDNSEIKYYDVGIIPGDFAIWKK